MIIANYTIEKIKSIDDIDQELSYWLFDNADTVAGMFRDIVDFRNFDFLHYCRIGEVWLCRRNGKPLGIMMARLYGHVFDPETKILKQDLLYVKEPGFRAASILMNAFVDFGKRNANLIFTMKTNNTNIKASSLIKLGFVKAEELFEMRGIDG